MIVRSKLHLNSLKKLPDRSYIILNLVLFSIIAYHGVVSLGLGIDDYREMYIYRTWPIIDIIGQGNLNRFPLWGLFIYPILLWLPLWLAHFIIIVFHTLASIFLMRLIQWFGFTNDVVFLTSLLFLMWPSHNEAIFWLSAGTLPVGLCIFLGGLLCLTRKHTILSFIVLFLGMTFSEALFAPGLFALLILLCHQQHKRSYIFSFIGGLAISYVLFEFARAAIYTNGDFTEYAFGSDKLFTNIFDLILLSSGLFASRYNVFLWEHTRTLKDITILLPNYFLFLSFGCIILFFAVKRYLLSTHVRENFSRIRLYIFILIVGYFSCFPVYIIITGNTMQNRYTYLSSVYLAIAFGISLQWLINHSHVFLRYCSISFLVLLLSVSLYRTWSTIWVNWYPARLVAERVITDVQQTHRETNRERVWLVNDPQLVGTGYALFDYVHASVGKLYVGPQFGLVTGSYYLPLVFDDPKARGTRFSDLPCAFLGWENGQRVVTKLLVDAEHTYMLNCDTQFVEPVSSTSQPYLTFYRTKAGRENLKSFYP